MAKHNITPHFFFGRMSLKVNEEILDPETLSPEALAILPIFHECYRILIGHLNNKVADV